MERIFSWWKYSKHRKIARAFYKNFPFFKLPREEFSDRCLILQRCGAGIVLGYVKDHYAVIIADIDQQKNGVLENVPLGRFGEIVFKKREDSEFRHTGNYGFFDQCGRVWCCGPIERTVELDDKKYFPYCIEPLLERIWWISSAKFFSVASCDSSKCLAIKIRPKFFVSPLVYLFKRYFVSTVKRFSKKFPITSNIDNVELTFW